MPVHSSQTVVEKVLSDMKDAIRNGRFYFVERTKNMNTLAELGILIHDVWDELLELDYTNYISGPETDRDDPFSDPLWIFKRTICDHMIYIKYKVEYQDDGTVKVISFHIDETA